MTTVSRSIRMCVVAAALVLCDSCLAEISGFDIRKREPWADGRKFGLAGAYERIEGQIRFTADPNAAGNRRIVDIDKAPRNARGLVEYQADFLLLKPVDPSRGNGALVCDIVNRGTLLIPVALRAVTHGKAQAAAPNGEDPDSGLSFLAERGFTILAVGWQHDVPPGDARRQPLRLAAPVATDQGRPIRGLVAVSFTLVKPATHQLLSDRGHVPYLVADPNAPGTAMRIRHLDGRLEDVPRAKWGFGKIENAQLVPDRANVYLEGGFQGGRTYEVVYQSENPPVAGLGYAAVRDAVSALKGGPATELGIPRGTFNRALALGLSQSGRFLRGFVHDGFNRDLRDHRVLDGVLAAIAGGNRVVLNYRFAQPSANPGLVFPFADAAQTDPETGQTGLLSDVPPEFRPKMIHLNTASEYWRASGGALIHTRVDGTGDVPGMESSRIYYIAGSQHGPGPWPPAKGPNELPTNPLNYCWVMRTLILALDRWVSGSGEPPASRYPRLDKSELVPPSKVGFPAIPGVTVPPDGQSTARERIGPGFWSEGPITIRPPRSGKPYPQLVAVLDADGNETPGIRLPELAVPLGTYMAWNQLFPGAKDMSASLGLIGGFAAFARNEAERKAQRDPRPSILERYGSRERYLGLLAEASVKLADEGLLLEQDIGAIVRSGRRQWDDLMK